MTATRHQDHVIREVFGAPIEGSAQTIDIDDTGANVGANNAFTPGTKLLVTATVACWFCFTSSSSSLSGTDGTDCYLPDNCPQVFTVPETYVYVACVKYNGDDPDGELNLQPLSGYQVP